MLITLVAAAFVLSVAVLVHEIGHFVVAKWAGVYVKTFSIGFGRRVLARRVGETVYAISALPFGGYVRFAGESELGGDDDEDDAPRGPHDETPDRLIAASRYYTRIARWRRAAILLAGPGMNYLTAAVLYAGILLVAGEPVTPSTTVGRVMPGSPADAAGLVPGDRIVSVDGDTVATWEDVLDAVLRDPDGGHRLHVRRGEGYEDVSLRARRRDAGIELGMQVWLPPVAGRVQRDGPAWRAGLREGARIVAIDDTTVTSYDDVRRMIHARPGRPTAIRWRVGGIARVDTIVPEPREVAVGPGRTARVGLIGVGPVSRARRVGVAQSVRSGFATTNRMIVRIVGSLARLASDRREIRNMGGPILISQLAGDVARWGFDYLLALLALFNANLCVFNLAPVVPLDGGHLTILAVEGVVRRDLPPRARGWIVQAGFILMILLMAFVLMQDIARCSGHPLG